MKNLLIYNVGLLATPRGTKSRRGREQGEVSLTPNCSVVIRDGLIAEILTTSCAAYIRDNSFEKLDAKGRLVTPGLVDCHTHLIFGGWRHGEFARKLAGATYLEILESGGGILSTVRHTREAGFEELLDKGSELLDEMLSFGVTTAEAKSGYGLNRDDEIKCLEVAAELDREHPVDLVSTFMGAHALPPEYKNDRGAYIKLCKDMIAEVASNKLAEFCDVFCEKGAFDTDESRAILEEAAKRGLKGKIHAEEITNLGGAELAAKLGCVSAEHLIKTGKPGLEALSDTDVTAVCLPCTSFYLGEDFAPARAMIDYGIPVAVATDFNPGSSPNLNIQLAMNLACLKYRLTPEEALTAVTLNAAAAINRAGSAGTIESGKKADLVVWKTDELSHIFYRYGSNLAANVIKGGKIVKI
jgi:imidazolonepropionase